MTPPEEYFCRDCKETEPFDVDAGGVMCGACGSADIMDMDDYRNMCEAREEGER